MADWNHVLRGVRHSPLLSCWPLGPPVIPSRRVPHCRGKPALVFLVAGYKRIFMHGAPPDWALELVSPPREQPARRDT